MREIWVADSETDPFKAGRIPAPFVWGVYNGTEYREFWNTVEFIEFMQEQDCILYAHNGGKFDWHFLLPYLEEFDELMVINGRLAKFRIGKCEFRDSFNILPIPLSAYKKDDIDYGIMEPEEREKPHNKALIQEYLRKDCIYLHEMVTAFIDRYGLNLTQAGAAMKVWSKISKTKPPETCAAFYADISPYYYGGRVECFRPGIIKTPFKVVDINSAYPYAMIHQHPWGTGFDVGEELPARRAEIEQCFITLTAASTGAFPHRATDGLEFPNDGEIRRFQVTGWEYLAALETGTLQRPQVETVVTFPTCISFTEYIEHFYQMKADAKASDDKAGYVFSKLFLNSLYGKFGANPDNYEEYCIVKPMYIMAAEEDGYSFCAELGPWALMSRPLMEEKQRYYNVAVAASITGFVRAYLWRAISQCKGVIYCDTDSIACADPGALPLDAEQLGAWDLEAECDYGGVAGKKLYAFRKTSGEWKTASKGVRLTPEEIIQVAKGRAVTHTPIVPSFSIKRGHKFISRKITRNA